MRKCLLCLKPMRKFSKTEDSESQRLAHRKCWLKFREWEDRNMDYIFTEKKTNPKCHYIKPLLQELEKIYTISGDVIATPESASLPNGISISGLIL